MDDLAERLTELLSSPDGLETVKNLAGSFMNSTQKPQADEADSSSGLLPFSPDQLQGIMKITSALNDKGKDDEKLKLLVALKPHLSTERQKRVDNAVKIMKIIKIMPLIQESGLFASL